MISQRTVLLKYLLKYFRITIYCKLRIASDSLFLFIYLLLEHECYFNKCERVPGMNQYLMGKQKLQNKREKRPPRVIIHLVLLWWTLNVKKKKQRKKCMMMNQQRATSKELYRKYVQESYRNMYVPWERRRTSKTFNI